MDTKKPAQDNAGGAPARKGRTRSPALALSSPELLDWDPDGNRGGWDLHLPGFWVHHWHLLMSGPEWLVVQALLWRWRSLGYQLSPGKEDIARRAGCSARRVQKHIHALEAKGLLAVKGQSRDGKQLANEYNLRPLVEAFNRLEKRERVNRGDVSISLDGSDTLDTGGGPETEQNTDSLTAHHADETRGVGNVSLDGSGSRGETETTPELTEEKLPNRASSVGVAGAAPQLFSKAPATIAEFDLEEEQLALGLSQAEEEQSLVDSPSETRRVAPQDSQAELLARAALGEVDPREEALRRFWSDPLNNPAPVSSSD